MTPYPPKKGNTEMLVQWRHRQPQILKKNKTNSTAANTVPLAPQTEYFRNI